MIVRFTGKFTDLIPNGWTFQKLFARNYRQYHKTCDGEQYSQGCRIWQHHGGYLEVADLGDLTAVLVKKIEDGKIHELGSESNFLGGKETVYWFRIDMENGIFHPRGSEEYKRLQTVTWDMHKLPEAEQTAFYKRYREFNLRPEMVTMLQDLVDKKWIKSEI
jgi:hypothetical protein